MSEGLCWKCKEKLKNEIIKYMIFGEADAQPWIHCHHEPKEKENCWCDIRPIKFIFKCNLDSITILYCPECGRKL